MARITTFWILLMLLSTGTFSQSQNDEKGISVIKKARYLKEDLKAFLYKTTIYSKDNLINKIQGDVVFSFTINKEGQMDSLTVESAAAPSLAANALSSLSRITNEKWSPAMENNIPIDKKYKIIFRFRQFINEEPFDYKDKAKHLSDKGKYEKALKTCNAGIKENQYDAAFYEVRSQIKYKMGDMEGCQLDHAIALTLAEEVQTVVNVYAIAKTYTTTSTSRTVTPHLRH